MFKAAKSVKIGLKLGLFLHNSLFVLRLYACGLGFPLQPNPRPNSHLRDPGCGWPFSSRPNILHPPCWVGLTRRSLSDTTAAGHFPSCVRSVWGEVCPPTHGPLGTIRASLGPKDPSGGGSNQPAALSQFWAPPPSKKVNSCCCRKSSWTVTHFFPCHRRCQMRNIGRKWMEIGHPGPEFYLETEVVYFANFGFCLLRPRKRGFLHSVFPRPDASDDQYWLLLVKMRDLKTEIKDAPGNLLSPQLSIQIPSKFWQKHPLYPPSCPSFFCKPQPFFYLKQKFFFFDSFLWSFLESILAMDPR